MRRWALKICVVLCVILIAAIFRAGYFSWLETPVDEAGPGDTIIVRVAQINLKHYLCSPGRAKFISASVHLQDQWKRVWAVVGEVDIQDSDGSRVTKPYLSAIQARCSDYTDRKCWRSVKLSIGEKVLVDVDLGNS